MSQESRQLVDCLTQLRLTSFRERHGEEAERAERESWTYSRYLLSLCQTELSEREQRRVARLLAASRLPRGAAASRTWSAPWATSWSSAAL